MGKRDNDLVGRRVICPDDVKGVVEEEFTTRLPLSNEDVLGAYVKRDDAELAPYRLADLKVIEPRTHALDVAGDERLGQLVAEMAGLRDAYKRYEALKDEVKAVLCVALAEDELEVAWGDGDAVEVRVGEVVARVYPMTRASIDAERMKAEYPEGYRYFLKRTTSLALKLLT